MSACGDTTLALLGGSPRLPDGPRRVRQFGPEVAGRIDELLATRPLSSLFGDHDVAAFEHEFRDRFGFGCAVAVSSGTAALHCALVALGIGPGDEVAVTCLSFVATVSVILQVGATPVFVDIDASTLAVSVADLERKVSERTRAVLVAHLFGIPAELEELRRLCDARGWWLVEDACQAHGARFRGRSVGAFGDVGCFSFNVNKLIQTGEGGMVVSSDVRLCERVRELRVNGLSPFGQERLGYNYTMTNLQALLGRYQLERFDETLERRRMHAEMIAEALEQHVEVVREVRPHVTASHYGVPFLVDGRDGAERETVMAALACEGIPVSGVYQLLYAHETVVGRHPRGAPCAEGERIVGSLLSIRPDHLFVDADVVAICEAIEKVMSQVASLKVALGDDVRPSVPAPSRVAHV